MVPGRPGRLCSPPESAECGALLGRGQDGPGEDFPAHVGCPCWLREQAGWVSVGPSPLPECLLGTAQPGTEESRQWASVARLVLVWGLLLPPPPAVLGGSRLVLQMSLSPSGQILFSRIGPQVGERKGKSLGFLVAPWLLAAQGCPGRHTALRVQNSRSELRGFGVRLCAGIGGTAAPPMSRAWRSPGADTALLIGGGFVKLRMRCHH